MDTHNPAPIVLDAVRAVARADVARRLAHARALRAVVALARDAVRSGGPAGSAGPDDTSVGEPGTAGGRSASTASGAG
jgi:hypothetical protein